MLTKEQAHRLAQEWVAAWNAHDLDRIMDHYEEEVELISPAAVQLSGRSDGKVTGKANLRAYFERGLAAYPSLHFDWDAMDRLHKKGYISDPKSKAKSVLVTEEGQTVAEILFEKYFGS